MSTQAWMTLGILIVMFALLVWNKLPVWLVFLGTLTVMMTLKLAPASELLAGFANSAVMTVGALFVVAAGMYSTGAINLVSAQVIGLPKSLRAAQLKILPPVAVGSAFLNNTPLVAMMIPVIRDLTRVTGLAGSYLFMPLSFASLLGGACTLIGTSTNLLIAGMVAEAMANGSTVPGLQPINMFTPSPVAIPAAIAGIAYLILVGPRLLPKPASHGDQAAPKRHYKASFQVQAGSMLVGKSLSEAGLVQTEGYRLVDFEPAEAFLAPAEGGPAEAPAVEEKHQTVKKMPKWQKGVYHSLSKLPLAKKSKPAPTPEANIPGLMVDASRVLAAGDVLTFECILEAVESLWTSIGLRPAVEFGMLRRHEHHLVEVVVAPSHPVVGRLISELPVRENPPYKAEIVAISHADQAPEGALLDYRIQAGDVGVLEVEDNFFYENRSGLEFSLIRRLQGYHIQRTSRAQIAILITIVMVLLAAFNVMSMLNASLLAAGAMLLFGCLTPEAAWRSIEFSTLVILGAAMGLGAAITSSGLATAIGNLLSTLAGDNAALALTVVFVGTVIMTNLITQSAAASFMFPIALTIAGNLNVNFMPFVIILILGTSNTFINPTAYQTNLMVTEPGGYRFSDFGKVGLPLIILIGLVGIPLAAYLYGF